jgi:outer membrane protein OmpA-like peptidoglycan-associated protein
MKKLLFCALVMLLAVPAMAIEPPDGVTPDWRGTNTAYTAREFNSVLEMYDISLSPEAAQTVPSDYAVASGDSVSFKNNSMAFTPAQYHEILTAYGLEINPQIVEETMGWLNYATASGDSVSFGGTPTAYNADEWKVILYAYGLPTMAVEEVVVVEPTTTVVILDTDGDGIVDQIDVCPGTPAGIEVDERGCWSTPAVVLFDFDSAVIRDAHKPVLAESKVIFDAYPEMSVTIIGHTCDIGPAEYNQGLSERRANAVRNFLVNEVGIAADRLTAEGKGEMDPAYPNDSKVNREKNRRVDFMVNY